MDDLPDGAIEVVLGEDARATEPTPSPGADLGATQPAGNSGNRTGLDARIDQLTARRREAERGRDEAEERAKRLEEDLAATKARLDAVALRQNATENHVQADLVARERALALHDVEGKLERLKVEKAAALEVSDFAKAASLDVEVAEALIEKRELSAATTAAGSRSPQPQPAQRVDPDLAAFHARNADWYNKDPDKTAKVWEEHRRWKAANPSMVGSPVYYKALEDAGRGNAGSTVAVPPLAGAGAAHGTTTTGAGSQRVVLTRGELETAKGWNMAPEVYAKHKLEAIRRGELRAA